MYTKAYIGSHDTNFAQNAGISLFRFPLQRVAQADCCPHEHSVNF